MVAMTKGVQMGPGQTALVGISYRQAQGSVLLT
jgi:hypothetical protein